ncbi:MAG TPA: hypothetical protein VMH32_14000 [Burkholderiales bacterium]|nr:hypothetical protein [Burkholderiales bacterium]
MQTLQAGLETTQPTHYGSEAEKLDTESVIGVARLDRKRGRRRTGVVEGRQRARQCSLTSGPKVIPVGHAPTIAARRQQDDG